MSEDRFDYVATKPCGCVVGLCADIKGCEKDTATVISGWIKSGLSVDRKPMSEVKVILESGFGCIHTTSQNQPELFKESL
jgi:hypothetical protein